MRSGPIQNQLVVFNGIDQKPVVFNMTVPLAFEAAFQGMIAIFFRQRFALGQFADDQRNACAAYPLN